MNRTLLFSFLWVLFLFGCGSDEEETSNNPPAPKPAEVTSRTVEEDPLMPVPGVDRHVSEIMLDFGQPASRLSVMDVNQSVLKDGKLYDPNGNLFTGKLRELYPDGRPAFESTYLEGLAHGQQLRWHESGHLVLEALLEDGIMVGMKTRWWPDGRKRDEEYWSKGRFRGRRLWDVDGRLIREELVNF